MDSFFHDMPFMFDKKRIRGMVDFNIGIPYLEGWVEEADQRQQRCHSRLRRAHACTSSPAMARCSAR